MLAARSSIYDGADATTVRDPNVIGAQNVVGDIDDIRNTEFIDLNQIRQAANLPADINERVSTIQEVLEQTFNDISPRSYGLVNIVINSQNYYDGDLNYFFNQDFRNGNEIPYDKEGLDNFRFVSQKFWETDGDSTILRFRKSRQYSGPGTPFSIYFTDPVSTNDDQLNYETLETIILEPDKEKFSVNGVYWSGLWERYVNGADPQLIDFGGGNFLPLGKFDQIFNFSEIFLDHATRYEYPNTRINSSELVPKNSKYFGFESHYNFMIPNYEEISVLPNYSETVLPNIYSISTARKNNLPSGSPEVKLNTLNGRLNITDENLERDLLQFFDLWSENIINVNNFEFSSPFKNIIFDPREVSLFEDEISQKISSMPMYVKTVFNLDNLSPLSDIIVSYGLDRPLMSKIVDINIGNEYYNEQPERVELTTNFFNNVSTNNWRVYNFEEWLANLDQEILFAQTRYPNDRVHINIDIENDSQITDLFGVGSEINKAILVGKVSKLMKQHFRSFRQILRGDLAFSDTIAYKITKHVRNQSEPIQNYYFANYSELKKFLLEDTQVKYGKEYQYSVWSYVAVLGNKYKYEEFSGTLEQYVTPEAKIFNVRNMPDIKIIELPYVTRKDILVSDNPPPPPHAEFIPIVGSDRTIKISLTRALGTEIAAPVYIEPEDEKAFYYALQKQKSIDGTLKFEGDDNISNFQVFKIDFEPKSYSDFRGNLVNTIINNLSSNDKARTPEVCFEDNILPNTKFWYMFRCVDVHQNVSNPSTIFEVELINNSGAIFPVVRSFDFKEEKKPTELAVQKYIRIRPSTTQVSLNTEQIKEGESVVDNLDRIELGLEEQRVWGDLYKLRVTSKATGKKIDINFMFKYSKTDSRFEVKDNNNIILRESDSFSETLLQDNFDDIE